METPVHNNETIESLLATLRADIARTSEATIELMDDCIVLMNRMHEFQRRAAKGDPTALRLLYIMSKYSIERLEYIPAMELRKLAANEDTWPVLLGANSNAINQQAMNLLNHIHLGKHLTGYRPKNLLAKRETKIKRVAACLLNYLKAHRSSALLTEIAKHIEEQTVPFTNFGSAKTHSVVRFFLGHAQLMQFQAMSAVRLLLAELSLTESDWDSRIKESYARGLQEISEESIDSWFHEAFRNLKLLTDDQFEDQRFGLVSDNKPRGTSSRSRLRDKIRDALKDAFRDIAGISRRKSSLPS